MTQSLHRCECPMCERLRGREVNPRVLGILIYLVVIMALLLLAALLTLSLPRETKDAIFTQDTFPVESAILTEEKHWI